MVARPMQRQRVLCSSAAGHSPLYLGQCCRKKMRHTCNLVGGFARTKTARAMRARSIAPAGPPWWTRAQSTRRPLSVKQHMRATLLVSSRSPDSIDPANDNSGHFTGGRRADGRLQRKPALPCPAPSTHFRLNDGTTDPGLERRVAEGVAPRNGNRCQVRDRRRRRYCGSDGLVHR